MTSRKNGARWMAEQLVALEKAQRDKGSTPQLGTSSIEDGTLLVNQDGELKGAIGKQSDGTNTVVQFNGPIPPAPSAPTAVGGTLSATISWDGSWVSGAVAPMDLVRIDVHLTSDDADDPLLVPPSASIVSQGWGEAQLTPPPGTWYAHLVAWTTSGKYAASAPSAAFDVALVEIEPPTDPPGDAPVLTGGTLGVGALLPSWTKIDDAKWYNVYASLTPGVDTDDVLNRVVQGVTGLEAVVATVGGLQIPYETPVYMKVRAVNEVGEGPESNEVSSSAMKPDLEFFSALMAWFGTVEAQSAIIGTLNVPMTLTVDGLFRVGDRITIGDPNRPDGKGGITVWGDDAQTIILARFHPDGNYLDGILVAQEITVIQALRLIGVASAIASGAKMKIENGIADPDAPSITSGVLLQNWPAIPPGYTERGICWDDDNDQWWQLLWRASNSMPYVRTIQPDGSITSVKQLTGVAPSFGSDFGTRYACNSIAYLNGKLYIQLRFTAFGNPWWAPVRYQLVGSTWTADWDGEAQFDSSPPTFYPVVGTDGTDVYGTYYEELRDYVVIHRYLSGGGSGPTVAHIALSGVADNLDMVDLTSAGFGVFDFGAGDFLQLTSRTGIVRYYTSAAFAPYGDSAAGPNLVPSNAKRFVTDPGAWVAYKSTAGTTDQPVGFYSSKGDSKLVRYSSYYPSAGELWWAQYADTGGGDHTAVSPVSAGAAVLARRFATVTLNPNPDGVTGADVYVGYGTTDPGATKKLRTETLVGRSMTLVDGKVTGTDAMPGTNTMGGSPGELFDDFGNTWSGDGVVELPGLIQPMFHRQQSAVTAAADGAVTKVAGFGTSVINDGSFTYSSGDWTCVIPGTFFALGQIAWDGIAGGVRRTYIYLGGSNMGAGNAYPTTIEGAFVQAMSIIRCEVGDVVSLRGLQSSGGTLNTSGDANTFLKLQRIAGIPA